MPDVILVVSGHPGRSDGLIGAAQRLAALAGEGRVRLLDRPSPASPTAPPPPEGVTIVPLAADADFASVVEAQGSRADFIVIAQPEPQDDTGLRHAFRAALVQTERPVLMVPGSTPSGAFGRQVAIAWRDDARTLKAVLPALRLLKGASQVHLLAGVQAGAATPAPPRVLLEHGVEAALHVLTIGSEPFGQMLLNRAHELDADLLIMGAHVHGALHDMLLGGVTRYIIAHADLPVLMRH